MDSQTGFPDREYAGREQTRHTASKYDFVKVKVYLGEKMDHYYVLSRYLISRMLTVTMIPYMKAVKIALEVKKHLVDRGLFDVSQEHLEAILFGVMDNRGFGNDFVKRYKMVTEFFQQRRPLIILICGVICTGKSTIAQQLASRLNLPNVLQTDIIYELMHGQDEEGPLHKVPLWNREDLDDASLLGEFQRECRVMRKGVNGDLIKCIRDGKSIIIEGLHLDPGLYLYEFGRYGLKHLQDTMAARAHPFSEVLPSPISSPKVAEADPAAAIKSEAMQSAQRSSAASSSLIDMAPEAGVPAVASEGTAAMTSDTALAQAAWKAARDSRSASFMLSFSQNSMQPRITSGSDAQLAALPSRMKTAAQSAGDANRSPAPASTAGVASSPAAEWLAEIEAASSIFHLRQGASPPTAVASSSSLPGGPHLSWRKFGKLPSAPAWLSRSRQLFATGKEPVVAASPAKDTQKEQDEPLQNGLMASPGEEEARQVVGPGSGSSSGSVKQLEAAEGGPKASGNGKEGRQRRRGDQSAVHSPWERCSALAGQHEGTEQSNGHHSAAMNVSEARHQMHELDFHSGPDDGAGQPGTLRKPYPIGSQLSAAELPMVSRTDRDPLQLSNLESELKKASVEERQEEGCAPASTPQQSERRSHSVRFTLPPSVQRPLPSKPSSISVGKQESVASVTFDADERLKAAAMGAPAQKDVKLAHRALDEGPVFVPIVMSMAEKDHLLLVEEWYGRQQAFTSAEDSPPSLGGVQSRLQALQKHLCAYAASNVPVVQTDLASMGNTLDKLHTYLLQCIAISMGQA